MSFLKIIKSKTDRANAQKERARKREQNKCIRRVKRYEKGELKRAKRKVKYEAARGRYTCTFWCNKQETVSYFQDRGFKVKAEPYIDGWLGKYKVEVEWE